MADVSEALERLAGLRDRGVLTEVEFDAQKAALLGPDASPAPHVAAGAPARHGPARKILAVVGGLVVLTLALWALGIVRIPHYNRPETQAEIDAELKDDNPKPATTLGVAVPSVAIGRSATPASAVGAASSNPLIGEWTNDGAETSECPAKITFAAATLTITSMAKGTPEVEVEPVSYTIQSSTSVLVTNANRPDASMPIRLQNGHIDLSAACSLHR